MSRVATWNISDLAAAREALDEEMRKRFDRLYRLDTPMAELVIPDAMTSWIEEEYGAVDAVERQQVVRVTNRWTLQTSMFNAFRAMRPQKDDDSSSLADEIYGDGPDPFDEPETNTAEDTFGRIRGEHCVTAGNLARSDASHGVIIFNEHNPWQVTEDAFVDAIDVAGRWFQASAAAHPDAACPLLIWNCLWKSGASINHAHMQMLMTGATHYGEIERLRRAAAQYQQAHGAAYFDDLFAVHAELGLGREVPGGRLLAHITPLLANECVLLAEAISEDFARSMFRTIRLLHERHGVISFNMALIPPPLAETPEDWSVLPVIARIVDRGNPLRKTIDTGAMELFAASVISADPFDLARSFAVYDGDRPVAGE